MKNNQPTADQSLREFLDDTDDFPFGLAEPPVGVALKSLDTLGAPTAVKNLPSFELMKDEIEALQHHWFEQVKICGSLLELLEEIEHPNDDTDIEQVKSLIHSELRWLSWDKQNLARLSNEEEVKLLKKLAIQAMGPKSKAGI